MRTTILLTLAVLAASPAAAQITFQTPPTAPPQAATGAKSTNPNDKIICEKQEEIGSRLGGKKVCKTKAQWELDRRQQREDVEGVQQQATSVGHSG